MAYQANIPQPTDQLSKSQGDILGNFQALQTLIDVNHVDFSSADQGKHKWVTFPIQALAPAFAATEIGLYNKVPAAPFPLTTVGELFIQKSTGANIPMTASVQSSVDGWTYLPSGIILQWNQGTSVPLVGNNVVSLPNGAGQPRFNTIFTVMLSLTVGSTNGIAKFAASNVIANPQTITINCSIAGMIVGYLIIGN